MGTLRTTVDGDTCLAWSSVSSDISYEPALSDENYPDGSRALAENNCRNPGLWYGGLWCYTINNPSAESWGRCDVPLCPGKCALSGENANV